MTEINLTSLQEADIDEIVSAFKAIGWHKPRSIYEDYLTESLNGKRTVIIAKTNNKFCGYVTIKWISAYSEFSKNNIPEIADLNVLPIYQKQGIGTKLVKKCEEIALEKGYLRVGLGVGLLADYGNAQRLYIQLGYMPDGQGLHHRYKAVSYNESVTADDDLVIYLTKEIKGE